MSHLRPEDRSPKKSRAACKKGRHYYGESQNIGAGILRRVCDTCGEITIDLTGVDALAAPIVTYSRQVSSLAHGDS